jgi:hypothetical protein
MLKTPVQAAAEGMPVSKTMTRRAALCGIATIPALGGATAALAGQDRPSGLADLIAAHKSAYAAFIAALDALPDDWDGDDADDPRSLASDAERDALCAILEHRPASQADAVAKVAYLGPLNKRGALDQQFHFDHLLASLLPTGEWLPREWWGWRTEYDVEAA